MKIVKFYDFTLLVGKCKDLFKHFGVSSLAGLSYKECYDSESDSYIAGLCNEFGEPFIYLNSERLKSKDKNELIYHESFHHALRHFKIELESEEKVVEFACSTAIKIKNELKEIADYSKGECNELQD